MATYCHSSQNQVWLDSLSFSQNTRPIKKTKLWPLVSSLFYQRTQSKGWKCKISRVLQSPVSSPQASPKVEASHRPKQAQHFSTRGKVQNGNSTVHQNLPDSRGMDVVDKLVGRLPSHPHPPKLKEIPKVLPQVTGVPVHLPDLRDSHRPPGLHSDRKRNEADGPDKGNQTSPIPGQLAYQGLVSGRSTSEHSDSGRCDPVLRVDNKSEEI